MGSGRCVALGLVFLACGGKTEGPSGGAGGTGGGAGGSTGGTGGTCVVTASGVLPAPLAPTARLTGPGIVATGSGFVLGYREQDGDMLRAQVLPLSDAGALGSASTFPLNGCATVMPSDGVSLAYRSGKGMFTASLPDCGQGAGAVFVPFDDQGQVEQASGPRNKTFQVLETSVHALAPSKLAGEFSLAYTVTTAAFAKSAEVVVLQGATFKNTPTAQPFGDGPRPWVSIASSNDVVALLAPDDSGALSLLVGPHVDDLLDLSPAPALPSAKSGDLVAYGPRVAAGARTAGGMHVSVLELGSGIASVGSGELATPGALSSALAVNGDDLFAVHGASGGITLQRVAGATGTPSFASAKSFDLTPPGLDFDGTKLAVAAARGKVAVVWLSRAELAGGATGGFLVASCD